MSKITAPLIFFVAVQMGFQSISHAQIGLCKYSDDFRFFDRTIGCMDGDTIHYSGYHNKHLFISFYCDLNGKILQFEEVQAFDGKKRDEVICNFRKKIIRGE